ncbi:MAG: hypothetical protein LBR07_01505 [Puniceicoccales bacterium]|jgi:hypothetical protein|nr:hypothetical protein [Puniceicoccales bacterium]
MSDPNERAAESAPNAELPESTGGGGVALPPPPSALLRASVAKPRLRTRTGAYVEPVPHGQPAAAAGRPTLRPLAAPSPSAASSSASRSSAGAGVRRSVPAGSGAASRAFAAPATVSEITAGGGDSGFEGDGVTQVVGAPKQGWLSERARQRLSRWVASLGKEGLIVSVALHVVMLVAAVFWVVTTYLNRPPVIEVDILNFPTGEGGGMKHFRSSFHEHKVNFSKPAVADPSRTKLTAKGVSSNIAPEVEEVSHSLLRGGAASGLFGAGGGGGIGNGGIGSGGKNFVGRMVFGMNIEARNIAVYLDNSGSMTPFLENVKRVIYEQFPTADVFEVDGIRTIVRNNKVMGGTNGVRVSAVSASNKILSAGGGTQTKTIGYGKGDVDERLKRMSARGRKIQELYAKNFMDGSVGAWADIMMYENYGALVVFSDFQDGEHESGPVPVGETPWKDRWVKQFSRRRYSGSTGPRLYLFSIEKPPGPIWQACVEASGGAIKMRPELRAE